MRKRKLMKQNINHMKQKIRNKLNKWTTQRYKYPPTSRRIELDLFRLSR